MMSDASPSKIPTPAPSLRRFASMRVKGERPLILYSTSPNPFTPNAERREASHLIPSRENLGEKNRFIRGIHRHDDDLDSLESVASDLSAVSPTSTRSNCEHLLFAKNGTTYSGRAHKYIVHCSTSRDCSTPEEYLTPTQRANRNVRRLKTLLQLAKEKLVEKEKEIFKLTQEIVELKIFKSSVRSDCLEVNKPSECTVDAIGTPVHNDLREFQCDSSSKASSCSLEKIEEDIVKLSTSEKGSPLSPVHGYQREHFTATPDHLLSSLADSGHFDDLASSLSIPSNVQVPNGEQLYTALEPGNVTDERAKLVTMYESMLKNCKDSYEHEMRSIKLAHEESNMQIVESFELKLKESEVEFEKKFNDLYMASEKEKIAMVELFERRLEDERLKLMAQLSNERKDNNSQTDNKECIYNDEGYIRRVQEEKLAYEKSLSEIKVKFNTEREKLEKNFDDVMKTERTKFESAVAKIQADYEEKIGVISLKSSTTEKLYNELLGKYQDSLAKIAQVEEENAKLKASFEEQESRQKELYLKMFQKGQEAVQFQHEAVLSGEESMMPHIIPVPELLVQLKVTEAELENLKDKEYRAQHSDDCGVSLISAKEALSLWMLAARKAMYKRVTESQQRSGAETRQLSTEPQPLTTETYFSKDPETTLQFLKSAVYYFLTDRDNHLHHLRAIENILGFSQNERRDISMSYVR